MLFRSNPSRLFAEIEPALNDKSYENWIDQSGIKKPIFPTFYSQYKGKIQKIKSEPEFQDRLAFEKEILSAKDAIEYDLCFQSVIASILIEKHSNYEDDVAMCISNCIIKYLPNAQLLSIDNIKLIPNELKMVRAQIKIRRKENYYSIWTCIPTALNFHIDRIMKNRL